MSTEHEEIVVLLVGSCGLDRLLTVTKYPDPDAKIRTTAYNEVGGGNAANTASAMGLLCDAKFLSGKKIRIKLLSKVGDDAVGQQLIDELKESNVDTSSPLFMKGAPGSNTALTTIIVSEEEHTRTCIHTPGTCGELTLEEVQAVDLYQIFRNVVHLHSDSRHTDVSLLLAREAKSRGIPVSCDTEKDRKTESLDELIQVADVLFTNSNYVGSYLGRLDLELQTEQSRSALPEPSVTVSGDGLRQETVDTCAKSTTPSAFFTRWYSQSNKQVVVTQGHMGALHYQPIRIATEKVSRCIPNQVEIRVDNGSLMVEHRFSDAINSASTTTYKINQVGVLGDLDIVDTTGAGDAFIGGYLMANLASEAEDPVTFSLEFASWVGGRKLEGPGARNALPTGQTVDDYLGTDEAAIRETLRNILSAFNKEEALIDQR